MLETPWKMFQCYWSGEELLCVCIGWRKGNTPLLLWTGVSDYKPPEWRSIRQTQITAVQRGWTRPLPHVVPASDWWLVVISHRVDRQIKFYFSWPLVCVLARRLIGAQTHTCTGAFGKAKATESQSLSPWDINSCGLWKTVVYKRLTGKVVQC